MTKEDKEDFEDSESVIIHIYVGGDVKVKGRCQSTGKYRDSAHRDCNINVKLIYKIPVVFRNLKNNDSHLIMQEIGKFTKQIRKLYEL